MSQATRYVAVLLLTAPFWNASTLAQCNVCSAVTGTACISPTAYKFCDANNMPTSTVGSCPTGSYCTSRSIGCIPLASELACPDYASAGQCNVCSSNRVACVSETSYKLCNAQYEPEGEAASCGAGRVCSTATVPVCSDSAATALVDCRGCDRCDAAKVFACTGPRTYALCLGTETPSAIVGTCDVDQVCNINSPLICVASSTDVPTCSAEAPPTTPITTPITNAMTYCEGLQQTGRFPAGDANCKQYVYCFLTGGSWRGQLYVCPGSTFFQRSAQICDVAVPEQCASVAAAKILSGPSEDIWLQ